MDWVCRVGKGASTALPLARLGLRLCPPYETVNLSVDPDAAL
jgi:hypothetical protein